MRINLQGLEYFLLAIGIFTDVRVEPLVMLLAVLLVAQRGGRIAVNRNILLGFTVLAVWSLTAIVLAGYAPWKFVQQFVLLLYFFIAYHILFSNNRTRLDEVFGMYLRVTYVLCWLGLLQFAVMYATGYDLFFVFKDSALADFTVLDTGQVTRVSSICAEPAIFARVITPALGYYLFQDSRTRGQNIRFAVIGLAFILTFGTMSYVAAFLMVAYKYLVLKKNVVVRVASAALAVVAAVFIAQVIFAPEEQTPSSDGERSSVLADVSMKIRDVGEGLGDFSPEAIETLNLSSYATLMNVWVAFNAPNRLAGTGLGTHEQNYQAVYRSDAERYGLNMQEGYALANRLYSELGVAGIVLFAFFLYKCHNKTNIINVCVFFALLTVTFRGGHYTRYGTVFFLFMYYYTSRYALRRAAQWAQKEVRIKNTTSDAVDKND